MAALVTADLYVQIRNDIINGKYASGELILEQAVAGRYGISKMTAREILQRLCVEKHLKSFPRKGYLVLDINAKQLGKIQQVRFQLEALGIKQVISNCADDSILPLYHILDHQKQGDDPYDSVTCKFHLALCGLADNEYAYEALHLYLGYICRYAITAIRRQGFEAYQPYHKDILDAVMARNRAAALEALRMDLMLRPNDL